MWAITITVNFLKNLLLWSHCTNLNQTSPRSSSGYLVSSVPADQSTWLPLLKVEHGDKISNTIQLKTSRKKCEDAIASKLRWNDTFKNCGWWSEPSSNMVTTVIRKRKFDNNFNKQILKNPEKGQLLLYFRKMIHLWLPFRIMVDNFSDHQSWPPPLLKIEHLTTNAKFTKINPVKCKLLPNFREIIYIVMIL